MVFICDPVDCITRQAPLSMGFSRQEYPRPAGIHSTEVREPGFTPRDHWRWWTSRLLPCSGYCKQCCDEHWDTCVSFTSGLLGVYAQPTGSGRSVAVTAVWQQRGRGPGCSLREGQTASTSEKGPFSGCCWGPPSRTATGRGSNLQAPSEQDPAESQSPALLKGGGLGPAPPRCVLHLFGN